LLASNQSRIDHLRVAIKRGCGRLTVDFALEADHKTGGSDIVAEAGGKSPEACLSQ